MTLSDSNQFDIEQPWALEIESQMSHAHRPGIVESRGGVVIALKREVADMMVGGDKV